MVVPNNHDHFGVFLGVPPSKETPIWRKADPFFFLLQKKTAAFVGDRGSQKKILNGHKKIDKHVVGERRIGLKGLVGSYILQSCSSAALALPKNQAQRSSSKPLCRVTMLVKMSCLHDRLRPFRIHDVQSWLS